MPSFDIDKEEITAFNHGNRDLIAMCFDEEQLFNQLKHHNNSYKYRLEISEGGLEQVRQVMDEFFYELVIEDNWKDYCVTTDKEADSRTVLRNSVMRKHRGCHGIFLMKEKLSIGQAIKDGATTIQKSGINMGNSRGKPTDHSGANRHRTGTYK